MKEKRRIVCLATLMIITLTALINGESTLSWRTFKSGDFTWIYYPKGIMLFSTLSRTLKPFVIDPVRKVETVSDCIESDGYLWVSSNTGLYQIEMATQSVERIPLLNDEIVVGKIAVDFDYVWLSTDSKFFRFDKLGREWMVFELPVQNDPVVGLWTNGDEVCRLGKQVLSRFVTSTEKWEKYPLDSPLSDSVIFYPGLGTFKIIDGEDVALYQPESFSWVQTKMGLSPTDIFDEDSVVYCSDGKGVNRVSCASGVTRTLNLPNPGNIRALGKSGDTLVITTDKRIGKFSITKETMEYTEYDPKMKTDLISKIIPLSSFYLIVTPKNISTYEKETKAWQHIPRTGLKAKSSVFSWNQEECVLRYAPGYQTKINGFSEYSIKNGVKIDDITGNTVADPLKMGFRSNVNVHTADKDDRIADVFLNNMSTISAPEKGVYYRGNRDDRLNSVRLGSMTSDQIESPLMPSVALEGAEVIVESKSRLTTRDRKKVRIAGGSGYIRTRTVKKIIPYRPDGIYPLPEVDDSLKYVKSSCRVYIDGEELDTTLFTFNTVLGQLTFNTLAPIDPASSIIVEYKIQTIPEGEISSIEFIPGHHFGKLHYGALTYSPTDWLSTEVGYTGIDRDSLNNIVNFAVPLEFRNNKKKFMLQFKPEVLYNITNEAMAANAQLQSRIGGKTGVTANMLFADSNFVSTDTLTQGYGAKKGEYDFTISHDIRQELPLSYYQHQKFGAEGVEDRFAASAGARFKGLPFLELTAARTVIEKDDQFKDTTLAVDSLYHIKDKLKVRLYETSSALLEKLTHFYKISYDLTHSENLIKYHGVDEIEQGRLTTMSYLLSPIQRIMLTGEVFYRGSMNIDGLPRSDIKPSFNLQINDAPPGVDVLGYNNFKFSRFSDMATDTIDRSLSVVLKPGQWLSALGWFSPRAKITQSVNCSFNTTDVSVSHMFSGLHGIDNSRLSRELGVNVYPLEGLLLTNSNEWAEASSEKMFNTINRIQYIYNASNIVTVDWNYYSDGRIHEGTLLYEKLWQSWLRTSTALRADVDHEEGSNLKIGPKLLLNLNFIDVGFIYALSNSHDVTVLWNRHNGRTNNAPDISYTFGLRIQFKPNVELQVSGTKVTFTEGKFVEFTNSTFLRAYF